MSDAELRELDGWIAEKFMEWSNIPNSNPLAWVDYTGKIITWETTSYSDAFQPTRLPSAFALVKREIERRGWGWGCQHHVYMSPDFEFVVTRPRNDMSFLTDNYVQRGDTEEIAGCLAVKVAIEGVA